MRLLILGLVVVSCTTAGSWIIAQEGLGESRRPLDLPAAGFGDEEEDEDAPESITFYGAQYEGDGFFWCLDKSCSMGWADEIVTLKQEMNQSIQQLSSRADFSLNAYSTNTISWSSQPKRANGGNKASALAWVSALEADGWTCLAPAAVQIIQIAHQSSKQRRQIMILGDGQPYCDGVDTAAQCLSDVSSANYEDLPVHTLYISATTEGIPFFQQLAQMNGGTFTLVQ